MCKLTVDRESMSLTDIDELQDFIEDSVSPILWAGQLCPLAGEAPLADQVLGLIFRFRFQPPLTFIPSPPVDWTLTRVNRKIDRSYANDLAPTGHLQTNGIM